MSDLQALIEETEIRLSSGFNPDGSQVYIADDENLIRRLSDALKAAARWRVNAQTTLDHDKGYMDALVRQLAAAQAVIAEARSLHGNHPDDWAGSCLLCRALSQSSTDALQAHDRQVAAKADLPDRETLGEVLALVDDYDGCHQRFRDWEALPDWEKEAHPDEEPFSDREDAEFWNRRADAVLSLLRGETKP